MGEGWWEVVGGEGGGGRLNLSAHHVHTSKRVDVSLSVGSNRMR